MDADVLVRDYIRRLEAAAGPLPMERRVELAGEVREHIETALAEAGSRDEVTIRNVLERLGPPEEIVAAEREPGSEPSSSGHVTAERARWGPIEIIALLLLTIGAIMLPVIGPLLGLTFAWISTQWTRTEKLVATGFVFALLVLPVLLVIFARSA